MNPIVKIAFCGNVDDGKSTLLGRLMFELENIFEDRLHQIQTLSNAQKFEGTDFALYTDGLKAESEQHITMDVAHAYFNHRNKRYVLIDTPGHTEYFLKMFSGLSEADAAILLFDITQPMNDIFKMRLELLSMLGIKNILICINKMDKINFSESDFENKCKEILQANTENKNQIVFIPVSATSGGNLMQRSNEMTWYNGPTLTEWIFHLQIEEREEFFFVTQNTLHHQDETIAVGYGTLPEKFVSLFNYETSENNDIVSSEIIAKSITGNHYKLHLKKNERIERGNTLSFGNILFKKTKIIKVNVLIKEGFDINQNDLQLYHMHSYHAIENVQWTRNNSGSLKTAIINLKENIICTPFKQNKIFGGIALIYNEEIIGAGTIEKN